jgi:hypothetical protein
VTSARISDDEFSSPCIPRISSGHYEVDVRDERSALMLSLARVVSMPARCVPLDLSLHSKDLRASQRIAFVATVDRDTRVAVRDFTLQGASALFGSWRKELRLDAIYANCVVVLFDQNEAEARRMHDLSH